MKINKFLAAGILAVSFTVVAKAQTTVYITGSTAFRSATANAITALIGQGPTDYTGTDPVGANAQTWIKSDNSLIVKTSWSGSNAGVQTVAQANSFYAVNFLPDFTTHGSGKDDPRSGVNGHVTAKPDIAMVDNAQSSSIFHGTLTDNNATPHTETYANLADTIVGVIPFQWVGSKGFPTGLSMTPQTARALYSSQFALPLAFWTGNNAHHLVAVYGTGRDTDSGTRVNAFAESGIGVFSQVVQWKPTLNGSGSVTSLALYPTQLVNGFSTSVDGNSGENSGGTLAGYAGQTLTAGAADSAGLGYTSGYLMMYLGISDANTATNATNQGVPLLWNGVAYSTTAVKEGSYTFWGYEHIMWQNSITGAKSTFATNLKNQILTTDPSPNVKYTDMQVNRAKEGTLIFPNYF